MFGKLSLRIVKYLMLMSPLSIQSNLLKVLQNLKLQMLTLTSKNQLKSLKLRLLLPLPRLLLYLFLPLIGRLVHEMFSSVPTQTLAILRNQRRHQMTLNNKKKSRLYNPRLFPPYHHLNLLIMLCLLLFVIPLSNDADRILHHLLKFLNLLLKYRKRNHRMQARNKKIKSLQLYYCFRKHKN